MPIFRSFRYRRRIFSGRIARALRQHLPDALSVTTYLLYLIAATSVIASVFTSTEWQATAASHAFILTAIIVPFLSIAIAFAFQWSSQRSDFARELRRLREHSRFLSLLEGVLFPHSNPNDIGSAKDPRSLLLREIMYGKLLEEMGGKLQKLSKDGIIEAFENYWEFAASFYALARESVECTSLIPIADYSKQDMRRYLEMQRTQLVSRNIPVSRTFIFEESPKGDHEKQFRQLCFEQAKMGFCLYYIILNECELGVGHKEILLNDFALIDGDILQLGTYSYRTAQEVLYYEFYALDPTNLPAMPTRVRSLFVPGAREHLLLMQTYRKPMSVYEWPGHPERGEVASFKDTFKQHESQWLIPPIHEGV